MTELNTLVLQEFAKRGLTIDEGTAVDARVVKFASKPMSKDDLIKLREKRQAAQEEVDEKGQCCQIHEGCIEIERNRKISEKHYIVKQYFGLSHFHHGAYRARFTTILKNTWDAMCRHMAFNLFRGSKLLQVHKQRGRMPFPPKIWHGRHVDGPITCYELRQKLPSRGFINVVEWGIFTRSNGPF
jgi:hypothetical protein